MQGVSWAHLWLSAGLQQGVERAEVVDAGQVLDRREQPDRRRVLRVGGQRGGDRVVGERDVLQRRGQDVRLQALAQQLGQLGVGGRGGGGAVGADVGGRLDLPLGQAVHRG